MSTYRVFVHSYDACGVPVGAWFTIEADDAVDAINEATMAARDCGWTETEAVRVILADYRGARA